MKNEQQNSSFEGSAMLKDIAAEDRRWAIGYKGQLLARVPQDLDFFRRMTEGCRVICGRRTLEDLPSGQPLEGRENWILSRSMRSRPGVKVFDSLAALRKALDEEPERETWVIGGGSVYDQLLPWCCEAWITRFDKTFDNSDCWFPQLDGNDQWRLVDSGETCKHENMAWNICHYLRFKKGSFLKGEIR